MRLLRHRSKKCEVVTMYEIDTLLFQ